MMKVRHSILGAAVFLALAPAAYAQSSGSSMGAPSSMGGTANMETVRQVQQQLTDMGHNPGPVDGVMGPMTKEAVKKFQQAQGMPANGSLDQQTRTALGVEGGAAASGGTSGSTSGGSSGSMGSSSGSTGSTGSSTGGASGSTGSTSGGTTSSGATGGTATGGGATGSGTTAPSSGARSGSTPGASSGTTTPPRN